MKSVRTIVVVSVALIVALGWAVMPPQDKIVIALPLAASKQVQCPAGTERDGKLCLCPKGSIWTGSSCAAGAEGPNTQHVTTVDLRR